jgi:signal transduction histidine kinase
MLGRLTRPGAMTDNFRESTSRRTITVETTDADALRETLDRLHLEAEELRAARKRLVLAADADRRRIERDLHQGVQQHLVALAVNLQLAGALTDGDPAAAKALLEEMGRDVQRALGETAQLAQRIYPPVLEKGGLAAALRAAAVTAGVPSAIEVAADGNYPAEIARTVYLCCLEALEHAGAGARPTVTVRDEEGALAFEVCDDRAVSSSRGLDGLRERVEALGGRLTIRSEPGRGTCVSGSLPIAR